MKAPQIIMIIIMAMNLGINLVKNGEPKSETYSFPVSLVSVVINVGLLIWGGFF